MPKLSDTMTEGTLVAWRKKKGDKVSAGEVIADIETDKATMEWESPEDGTLTEIYVEEGGKVNVGDRIAFIGEPGEAPSSDAPKKEEKAPAKEKKEKAAKPAPKAKGETEKPAPAEKQDEETAPPEKAGKQPATAKAEPATEKQPAAVKAGSDEARVKASPVARRVAAELGVDLSSVNGTGPDGRVTESDVRAASKSQGQTQNPASAAKTTAPVPKSGVGSRINLSGMRKVIAERLVESKGPVPHFYLNINIDAGPLMAARSELKSAGEGADTAKITVNDFVLKAAVQAAVKVPKVNASFDGDAIVQYADVDLGIAVAIPDGLLTPVIRAAQNKSLRELTPAFGAGAAVFAGDAGF